MNKNTLPVFRCPILRIGQSQLWKRPPVRDLYDFIIILTLLDCHAENKLTNIASISETSGISKATASRRVNYLISKNVVVAKKSGSSTFIALSDTGIELGGELVKAIGCPLSALTWRT